MTKPWWQSKTILANLTALAVWIIGLAIDAAERGELPDTLAPYAVMIALAGNLLLRVLTNQPVDLWKLPPGNSGLGVALLAVLGLYGCQPSASPKPNVPKAPELQPTPAQLVSVPVYRHRSVPLTATDADRILAAMSAVISRSDRVDDATTLITFQRSGPVKLLPDSVAPVIQTAQQFDDLVAAPAGVKVVRGINWCGGAGAGIIGCAPIGSPGVNLAVVRFDAEQEGILWAHECGHNCGLDHRTSDRDAVMAPVINHNRCLTPREARRFRLHFDLSAPAAAGAVSACDCLPVSQPGTSLRALVCQHWTHGLPAVAVAEYSAVDVATLLPLLDDPAHAPYWPHIIAAIGYRGDGTTVARLVTCLHAPTGGEAVMRAKHAAAIHLGDLIRRTDSAAAIDCLAGLAQQPALARAAVAGVAAQQAAVAGIDPPTIEELADELAISALVGLARADRPAARAAISDIRESTALRVAVRAALP